MRIETLSVKNYRSLEDVEIDFTSAYSAICGRNNAGKTSIVSAIRVLLRDDSPYVYRHPGGVSHKEDFPVWKAGEKDKAGEAIIIRLNLRIDKEADAGLHKFIGRFANVEQDADSIRLVIASTLGAGQTEPRTDVSVNGDELGQYEAKEVANKLRSSRAILFYNSAQLDNYDSYRYRRLHGGSFVESLSAEEGEKLTRIQTQLDKFVTKVAKQQQQDIADLLGKLEDKYKVGLSVPTINLDHMPFDMSLGDRNTSVPLADWGSGTRNRTQILLTLFRAKRIVESDNEADKITPVLIIEEPESFLHPSAQAEFGRVLQDLAEEFDVQVISTTHSPYMLSMDKPSSNVLLERSKTKTQLRETKVVDTEGDSWMEPFGLALGIDNSEFVPWRELLFSANDSILLVEGSIDKEYFEMLRDPAHGDNALRFDGEIFAYGGAGTLKNTVLLKFIINKYDKYYITYDMDCQGQVSKTLKALGLNTQQHSLPIGIDKIGKKAIEGLVPSDVVGKVYGANPDLTQQATGPNSSETKSARNKLKRLILEEFQASAEPGADHYSEFYKVAKKINIALC